jgi:hypothetical protein
MRKHVCAALVSLGGVIAAVLPAVTASAAAPAPTFAIARSVTGAFTGVDLGPCTGTNTGSAAVAAQSTGSFGQSSLRLAVGSNDGSDPLVYKDYATAVPAADFALSYDIARQGSAPAATPVLDIYYDADGNEATPDDQDDLLYAASPLSTGWKFVAPLGGDALDDGTGAGITWADFLTAHPAATVLGVALDAGCDPELAPANSVVLIDNLTMSTSGTTASTYDFELPPTLTFVPPTTIVAGGSRTLSATLKQGSNAMRNQTVQLWAKPYGGTNALVGTRTTDASGMVFFAVRPVVQTVYYFSYTGPEANAVTVKSPARTLNVATRISKNIYDTTVTTAQPILAYGVTYPAKPGTYVYLYRSSAKIATARVASDGSYLLQARITTKGRYSLKVLGGAGSGSVSGTSAATTVTVS